MIYVFASFLHVTQVSKTTKSHPCPCIYYLKLFCFCFTLVSFTTCLQKMMIVVSPEWCILECYWVLTEGPKVSICVCNLFTPVVFNLWGFGSCWITYRPFVSNIFFYFFPLSQWPRRYSYRKLWSWLELKNQLKFKLLYLFFVDGWAYCPLLPLSVHISIMANHLKAKDTWVWSLYVNPIHNLIPYVLAIHVWYTYIFICGV